MRGRLMKMFTKDQHELILAKHPDDAKAAEAYSIAGHVPIGRTLVRYWRTVFQVNEGNQPKADAAIRNAGNRKLRKPDPDEDKGTNLPALLSRQCVLHIPDIHAPYQHPDALAFLKAVKAAFPIDLVVNAGDELDYHALSFHDSDPDLDSAGVELSKGRKFLQELERVFPTMLICSSNHGSMAYRKAKHHGIPVSMIRSYREVIFAAENGKPTGQGKGWHWADEWFVGTPMGDVLFKHSSSGILADAAHNRCNLMVGHSHGNFSTEYCASRDYLYWGAYGGCLIDKDAYAFAYGKLTQKKPIIGCTVILQGRPVQIPMILDAAGRWVGKL